MNYFLILVIVFLTACSASGGPAETPSNTAPAVLAEASHTAAPAPSPADASPTAASEQEPVAPTAAPSLALQTPTLEAASAARSVGIEDASAYTWRPLAARFENPLDIQNAGDGSGRLFILEQAGRVRIFLSGSALPEPYLDLTDRVGSAGSEQGLLGLAFHPDYPNNGLFFVNYTDLQGDTVIARFQVSQTDPNRASPESQVILLRVSQPFSNHNGGAMVFGPDGYLYIGLGDGGSAGDPQNNAQSVDTLLGKILRLDVDRGDPYAIPSGNPFSSSGGRPEIWAYGLRNPWRLAFDDLTGDLYIGDVGQNQWEEINFLPADRISEESRIAFNFGWPYFEAGHAYSGAPPQDLRLIPPISEYSHQFGCSVTGGVIYRGVELPAWQGIYLYGDYCTGFVWGLWPDLQGGWENRLLFENVGRISTFGTDERGEIYLADLDGLVYQLTSK